MELAEYNITFVHIKGRNKVLAMLSPGKNIKYLQRIIGEFINII